MEYNVHIYICGKAGRGGRARFNEEPCGRSQKRLRAIAQIITVRQRGYEYLHHIVRSREDELHVCCKIRGEFAVQRSLQGYVCLVPMLITPSGEIGILCRGVFKVVTMPRSSLPGKGLYQHPLLGCWGIPVENREVQTRGVGGNSMHGNRLDGVVNFEERKNGSAHGALKVLVFKKTVFHFRPKPL